MSDDAQGRHTDPDGEQSSLEVIPTFEACAKDDDLPQSGELMLGEATRVAPEALIESLREASRSDAGAAEVVISEDGAPPRPADDLSDDDDTLELLASHEVTTRSVWRRKAGPLAGAAALASLIALAASHEAPHPRPVETDPQPARKAVSTAAPQQVAPQPTVEPLPIISAEQVVDDEAWDAPVDEQTQDPADTQRRWMRALTRGQRQLDSQDYDAAILTFERAIEYNPSDSQGHAGLGKAQLGRGNSREAVRAFRKAVTLLPSEAAWLAGLGAAYAQGGDASKAAEAYSRALALDPSLAAAEEGLADLRPDGLD